MTTPADQYRALLQEVLALVREVEQRPEGSIPPSVALDGAHAARWRDLVAKIKRALKGESSPN